MNSRILTALMIIIASIQLICASEFDKLVSVPQSMYLMDNDSSLKGINVSNESDSTRSNPYISLDCGLSPCTVFENGAIGYGLIDNIDLTQSQGLTPEGHPYAVRVNSWLSFLKKRLIRSYNKDEVAKHLKKSYSFFSNL